MSRGSVLSLRLDDNDDIFTWNVFNKNILMIFLKIFSKLLILFFFYYKIVHKSLRVFFKFEM